MTAKKRQNVRDSKRSNLSTFGRFDFSTFERRYGAAPAVVARAPGRVNLIGEHTDYNDGFVLPFAIEASVYVTAGRPSRQRNITVYSAATNESADFAPDVSAPATSATWQNYVRGVVAGLRDAGVGIEPAALYIDGDLPPGAGLASSAALCVSCALALIRLADAEMEPQQLARLAQRAEHEYAGTPCGIMDPYVSLLAEADHALLIDCRSVTHTCVPLRLSRCRLLIIDSGIKHELADGSYGRRVKECRQAVAVLKEVEPSIGSLRDVTEDMLNRHSGRLEAEILRRARHVMTENARVQRTADALRQSNLEELGRCLAASHRSLRDDYEVSVPEMEELMSVVNETPGVVGGRMTGGGFGGSIIAVVRENAVDSLQAALDEIRRRRSADGQPKPAMREVRPCAGAQCHRITCA